MFYRKVIKDLEKWSGSPYRKPLLLRGARQVGKTTAVRMFSKSYDCFIELNLELSADREIFETTDDVEKLFELILLSKGIEGKAKKTLLFIDEIQNSTPAFKSLRYFYEKLPHIHVIAAGSLLEIYMVKQSPGMAVGRVENMWMHPMDFEEYLLAAGQDKLLEYMDTIPYPEHVYALLREHFMDYALIGGMPEAVKIYLETKSIQSVRKVLETIALGYNDDIVKYAHTSQQAEIIRFVWQNIPYNLGRQISFNKFAGSNSHTRVIRAAVDILELSSLIRALYPYTVSELPAIPNRRKNPKFLILDTGLLNYIADTQSEYYGAKDLNSIFKGMAMEHIVGQSLLMQLKNMGQELSFWMRDLKSAQAELDYVLPYDKKLIPVEVKAGAKGSLKSLLSYMEISGFEVAVRIYDGEFSIDEISLPNGNSFKLLNLPLPLSTRVYEYIDFALKPLF